jgi:transcription initiation factor TFIID TATA-box-binding protein
MSSEVKFKVQNVVVTARIADALNLLELNEKLDGAKYEPGKFPALRIKRCGVGFLLYSSGNIVCTGSKSPEGAENHVKELAEELQKHGVEANSSCKVNVRNIVASADIGKELKLHELAYAIEDSEYNPEAFPGMKLRVGGAHILIFRTGKAIVPGLKSIDDVKPTVEALRAMIDKAEEDAKILLSEKE